MSRLALLLAAVLLAVVGVAGCSVGVAPVLPPSPPVVEVGLREYAFDFDGPVPAGRVLLRVRNTGTVGHRVSLVPLSEDIPPIEEQLRGDERRVISPFAGVPVRDPGQEGVFAVDLVAGQRYALLCFVAAPDGQSHAVKGMASEFYAGGGPEA